MAILSTLPERATLISVLLLTAQSISPLLDCMINTEDFVSSADASEMLGVSRSTLNQYAQNGLICPAIKLPGVRGGRLYLRSDVLALVEERKAALLKKLDSLGHMKGNK